jgi:hypothetical protein
MQSYGAQMALSGQPGQGPHHRGGDNSPPPGTASARRKTPPGKIAAAISLSKPQATLAHSKKQTPLHFFID